MKLATKLATAIALATVIISAPASAEKPVELQPTELAAVQSRTYTVPADVAFKSVVAALQTLGYVDIDASKDAGTVSGQTEAKAKAFYNILWGFGKKKRTQKASLLIEDNGGAASLVRLNLIVSESKARGIWGTSFNDGKLVRFADPYNEFFAALDAEIARRSPVTSGLVPAAAAPVPAVPATTVPVDNSAAPMPAEPDPANIEATPEEAEF